MLSSAGMCIAANIFGNYEETESARPMTTAASGPTVPQGGGPFPAAFTQVTTVYPMSHKVKGE